MDGRSCCGCCLGMARSCAGLKGEEWLPLSSLIGRPSASRIAVSEPMRLHMRNITVKSLNLQIPLNPSLLNWNICKPAGARAHTSHIGCRNPLLES